MGDVPMMVADDPFTPGRTAAGTRSLAASRQCLVNEFLAGLPVMPAKRSAARASSQELCRRVFWVGYPLTRCSLAEMARRRREL
jgi:hypothetical protein